MQLVCKRRHTAFVVANGGGKLLRKSDDLRYANALPEPFVEGGQPVSYTHLDVYKRQPHHQR